MSALSRRDFLGAMAGAALAPACVLDGRLKLPMEYTPEDLDDGWPIADPASVGIDPEAI